MDTAIEYVEESKKRKKTIYHFLDYRQYLQELFTQLVDEDESFSYRAFARMAGSSSPNFLQLILAGKLCISDRHADSITRYLNFRDKETAYFRALIDFDHSNTHAQKSDALSRIISLRCTRSVNHIAEYQYEYFAEWYNPVVRELVCSSHFSGDLQWVVDQIVPEIGIREVKRSVLILEELQLIKARENGVGWEMSESVVNTPDEVISVAVVAYHRQMLQRATAALDLFAGDDRDIRAVTMGISKEKFLVIKERMTAFWHEMLELAEGEDDAEMVVQINTQLFPFTKI